MVNGPRMSGSEPPQYTKYRARPSLFRRRQSSDGDTLSELREQPPHHGPPAPYTPHRRRRRFSLPTGPVTGGRVVKWLVLAITGWVLLSLVVFLVSAQIQQGKVSDATERALAGGGLPLTSPTTILVLGSDTRSSETAEPGASTSGSGRSDSIMLLRVGGGKNSRLSIARDTLVDVPGAGRQKINAAYAIGGAPLAIQTISQYLGTDVNHIIEVSFDDFPDLIDAMGGINYKGGCVVAKVNGGYANGGVTIRIKAGQKKHLDGKQALALARVRENSCNRRENDLTRARRQQRILASMRNRVLGPAGFIRLPFISWNVPRTFKTDMSGPTLMAVFANLAVGGTPETRVLGTESGDVPDALKQRRVEQFLDG
jgi:LCP family protein required for cell wall assembly